MGRNDKGASRHGATPLPEPSPAPFEGHARRRRRGLIESTCRQSSTSSLMDAFSNMEPQAWFRTTVEGGATSLFLYFGCFFGGGKSVMGGPKAAKDRGRTTRRDPVPGSCLRRLGPCVYGKLGDIRVCVYVM